MKVMFNNFHLMVIKQGLICTLKRFERPCLWHSIPPTSLVFISRYGFSPKVKISHIVTPKLHTSLLVVKRCLSKLSKAYLELVQSNIITFFIKELKYYPRIHGSIGVLDQSMYTRLRCFRFVRILEKYSIKAMEFFLRFFLGGGRGLGEL